ncbi:hypothetical protein LC147_04730 [Vibrio harveyi]|jgi:hypothetical protein|uniref:hypothetical protein n=1 Tax=Vibrio TaxID=662 RepID=UPI000414C58F|nr:MULTISPECIES: hypothetical protein [Vibrio]APP07854.1 hypothetical protein BG259_21545 [Vibrio harveyi]HDM8158490.1 hypothetical protein [Vibrio harveyi]
MNKLKKSVTVRFFSIDATSSFFDSFSANYAVSCEGGSCSRIITNRTVKHLIKTLPNHNDGFIISVVKERNTWQTKATRDGEISGLALNQGIIGDPYYFSVIPEKKLILGFTTGPIGSLKSVAKFALEQFNSSRTEKIDLSLIPKEKEYDKLRELPDYSSLHFKINSSSLSDLSDDAPLLIKNLGSAPYIDNNIQLSLDLDCSDEPESIINKESLIEIVNYLSENDACTLLKVKGVDSDGQKVNLDFGNAFMNYKADLKLRNKYIDQDTSLQVLRSALDSIHQIFS